MNHQNPIPPRWADRFLAWYCNNNVIEQVQGDAHELFYWRVEEKGLASARRAFIWDVVRLFKWSNIKRNRQNQQLNNIAMFKNYIKIGLRNLWKQKMPSTINIIGLSLAVGCCLVSFKWIEAQLVRDRFHEHAYETYLVTPTRTIDGDRQRHARVSLAVVDMLKEEVPGIDHLTRFAGGYGQISVNNDDFGSYFNYTDPEFLEVFSFPFVYGDKSALDDPRSVVIDESSARAYFGDEYPIGKPLTIEMNGEETAFTVGAVIEDSPENSTINPRMLVNFSVYEESLDRNTTNVVAFIVLNESVDPASLADDLDKIMETKNAITPKAQYDAMSLEPLITMAKNGRELANGFGGLPPIAPFILLGCIGLFMLLLSTFNYVNIATVMAMKRVKEIGVRKVIGGRRKQLIVQFLTENLMLCLLAIVLGCLLASAFFIPWFNDIASSNLGLDLLNHQNLWWFLLALLIFITLVSGAYPAFYISSFKPVVIFRGTGPKSSKRRLTGSLLTFQMVLAVLTIVAGIMFVQTNRVNEARDWGYDQESKLVFRMVSGQTYAKVRAELAKNPNILEISASRGIIGRTHNSQKVTKGENEIYATIFQSVYNYPEMMGLRLTAGNFFNEQTRSQNRQSLIVNERFLTEFRTQFTDGLTVRLDTVNYNILGVVEDFHFSNFSDVITPAAFRVVPDSILTDVTMKVRSATAIETMSEVETAMENLDSEHNFHVFAQSSIFDNHFIEMNGIRNVMLFTATLSMLLSAMGLFGLVTLSISSRLKDFSIKKVLGASLLELSKDVYKRFAVILGLAIVIGGALSVFVISALLDAVYGYHENVGAVPLALAGFILLLVAAVTINTQVRNVKKMNPAETLRTE